MEIVRDTFGDWQVRCAPEGDECFMYQLALDPDKNPVAEVSILKLPEVAEAAAGATVVTPLGTLLTNGVVLQIDGGETRQYPFAWCSQVGCFSRFGLAETSIEAMKRGKVAKMSLVSIAAPEKPVLLDLSLKGFTDAYNSLATPPAPEGVARAPAAAPVAPKQSEPLPSLMPRN
jgi:invasion protein IalB